MNQGDVNIELLKFLSCNIHFQGNLIIKTLITGKKVTDVHSFSYIISFYIMHFLKNKNNQESNFTKFRGKKSSGNICEIQSSDFQMIPAYSRSLKTYDNYISTKSLTKIKESKYSNG